MDTSVLFSGKIDFRGAVSNEKELLSLCPEEFKANNPWLDYAIMLHQGKGNVKNWKWKTDDKVKRAKQFFHFHGVLNSVSLPEEHKDPISAWMLSEMLSEIPGPEEN